MAPEYGIYRPRAAQNVTMATRMGYVNRHGSQSRERCDNGNEDREYADRYGSQSRDRQYNYEEEGDIFLNRHGSQSREMRHINNEDREYSEWRTNTRNFGNVDLEEER